MGHLLKSLIKASGERLVCPFYHTVAETTPLHIKHLYQVKNKKAFVKDLDTLLKHYSPIDYKELLASIQNKTVLGKNSFLLSFDDGLHEFYDTIVPVLKEKGIPAICFINPDFIDNKDLFYRYKASLLLEKMQTKNHSTEERRMLDSWFIRNNVTPGNNFRGVLQIAYANKAALDTLAEFLSFDFKAYLKEVKPYLDSLQIKELTQQGFSFGAHSMDHPEYQYLPLNAQIEQTKNSIDFVTAYFKPEHRLFSFPFTDYNVSAQFFETIYAKNAPVADMTFGCAGIKKEDFPYHIHRIPFEGGKASAQEILTKEYLYYFIKSMFKKNRINRINEN
jgi:peptidoglycan/xylan/chitin deacetylase (PgdA/CDA1 family)